jgi:hypothetical protein
LFIFYADSREDVQPEKDGDLMPFFVSNSIRAFKEGHWIDFADVSDDAEISPGQVVKVNLTSSAPPGLIECRASGETVLEGVDEDLPPELEALLPGYEEWPHGYTIGPDERGKGRTPTERAKHLLAELPLLEELGLITPTVRQLYESDLRRGDLEAIVKRAERDLWSERISSEVFALIQTLK